MQTAEILLGRILFIAVMAATGYLLGRIRMLDEDTCRKLSDLLLSVFLPCLILSSYQTPCEDRLLTNLLYAFLLAGAAHAVHILLANLVFRRSRPRAAIERMSVVYSNCAFMGIPLIEPVYGAEGVLYLTAFVTWFNLLFWTHGVITVSGKPDRKQLFKKLFTPSLLAIPIGLILLLAKVQLPPPVLEPIRTLGSMTTPVSMLVAGATICRTDIRAGLRDKGVLSAVAMRLLLVPLAVMLLFAFLPLDRLMRTVLLTASCCPTASSCTLLALRYRKDAGYASQIFALSTLLSAITLPLLTMLAAVFI